MSITWGCQEEVRLALVYSPRCRVIVEETNVFRPAAEQAESVIPFPLLYCVMERCECALVRIDVVEGRLGKVEIWQADWLESHVAYIVLGLYDWGVHVCDVVSLNV